MDWLKKLWNGEYSLPMSYWVFLIIISNFGGVALITLSIATGSALLMLLASLVVVVYTVIAMVGTWRSATTYTGWKGWAIIVKVLIVFGAIKLTLAVFSSFV